MDQVRFPASAAGYASPDYAGCGTQGRDLRRDGRGVGGHLLDRPPYTVAFLRPPHTVAFLRPPRAQRALLFRRTRYLIPRSREAAAPHPGARVSTEQAAGAAHDRRGGALLLPDSGRAGRACSFVPFPPGRASSATSHLKGTSGSSIPDRVTSARSRMTQAENAEGAVVYAAPTWSPDASLIAFARISVGADSTLSDASLYTVAIDGKRLSRLLSGTRLQPFYFFWSPDSRRVSLLSQVRGQNALELAHCHSGRRRRLSQPGRGSPGLLGLAG